MKTITHFISIILIIFLFPGCQNDLAQNSSIPKDQANLVEKCIRANEVPNSKQFGYLSEDANQKIKAGWYAANDIQEGMNVYMSFTERNFESVRQVVLENSSPSGDWYRIDNYCFNEQGQIVELYSDLRTFQGNLQILRTWQYLSDGSISSFTNQAIDMESKNPINPAEANYLDHPPYPSSSYNELIKFLDLQDFSSP